MGVGGQGILRATSVGEHYLCSTDMPKQALISSEDTRQYCSANNNERQQMTVCAVSCRSFPVLPIVLSSQKAKM